MKLNEIIQSIPIVQIIGDDNVEIAGIDSDSRKILECYLFVAVTGTQSDGHDYIDQAIENGAKAIVCQQFPSDINPNIVFIRVNDSTDALGRLASEWYGNPSSQLILVGVTGTNGKTTVASLLHETFKRLGYRSGLLSTVCNYIHDKKLTSTHTTPDPIQLNCLLAEMVSERCEYAFMEVSSHAIDQKRISGLRFKGGIFTNLTRDHLDYHKTVEAYRDTKKAFFDQLPTNAFALTNKDDKNGLFMLQNTQANKQTYSMFTLADFKGKIMESHFDGTAMTINGKEINTQFVGKFNAYNLLAVYGTSLLLGENSEDILVVLSTLQSVAGRFQTIRSPKGYTVVVDYAHTPDALTNVLNAIHGVLESAGRIITVVGCGGNRDKGKRPIMAKEAVRLSNQVILTSDNPRNEEPEEILRDMTEGLDIVEKKKAITIVDRKEAIKTACLLAQQGDVILIAGKGHEDYQEIKGEKHHFDDREIVMEIIDS